jgi:branched-subunit amino acid transport protein
VTFWLTVGGMLAVTFGSRLAGLSLQRDLPPFVTRCLHFVPVAVFAALVTPALQGDRGEGEIRLLAACATALVAWRLRSFGVALAVGMATFWLLRVPW